MVERAGSYIPFRIYCQIIKLKSSIKSMVRVWHSFQNFHIEYYITDDDDYDLKKWFDFQAAHQKG